jgi:hypothetical protein
VVLVKCNTIPDRCERQRGAIGVIEGGVSVDKSAKFAIEFVGLISFSGEVADDGDNVGNEGVEEGVMGFQARAFADEGVVKDFRVDVGVRVRVARI